MHIFTHVNLFLEKNSDEILMMAPAKAWQFDAKALENFKEEELFRIQNLLRILNSSLLKFIVKIFFMYMFTFRSHGCYMFDSQNEKVMLFVRP